MTKFTTGTASAIANPAGEAPLRPPTRPSGPGLTGPETPLAPTGAVAPIGPVVLAAGASDMSRPGYGLSLQSEPRSSARRSPCSGLVGCAALVAGVLASTGMSAPVAAAALTSVEPSAAALAPGTIFVANARVGLEGGQGTGEGSVTAYDPTATGNVRPVLVITNGIMGPSGLIFDSSGDLWVANNSNYNNVVEYSKAERTRASPAPTVTISQSGSGAMGLAFDSSGDLWVTKNNFTVVEFTKAQLAKSGSPVPQVTISNTNQCSVALIVLVLSKAHSQPASRTARSDSSASNKASSGRPSRK